MGMTFFPGDNEAPKSHGMRSYVDPSAYQPTPPKEKPEFHFSFQSIRLLLIGLGCLFIFWILLFSPIFKIKTITLKGDASSETKDVVNQLAGKNIFLIGGKKAESMIVAQQPGISKIKILRGLPSTVVVELVERDPVLIWHAGDKDYLVDKEGVAFKEAHDTLDLPRINDQKNLNVAQGEQIISQSFIAFVRSLTADLPKVSNYEINVINVPETTFQISVETKNGPTIKLDTSQRLDDQLNDIKYILDHYKDKSNHLIDVRLRGFAYIN
jgi:cell division septal protein FtsQ